MSAKDKKETLKKLIIDAWVDGHEKTSPHKGSIDYDADLECYLEKVSPIVNEMCEGNTQPDTGSGLHLADVIKSLPGDEDITKEADDVFYYLKELSDNLPGKQEYRKGRRSGFLQGARWYANKIGNVL